MSTEIEIGTDIQQISDFKRRISPLGDLILCKIFTESELRENANSMIFSFVHLAGIFAAKEAFMKAYGSKIDWHEVWVEKTVSGKPVIFSSHLVSHRAKVSISHDGDYAVATVVITKG